MLKALRGFTQCEDCMRWRAAIDSELAVGHRSVNRSEATKRPIGYDKIIY
jgi:hypothetical protein